MAAKKGTTKKKVGTRKTGTKPNTKSASKNAGKGPVRTPGQDNSFTGRVSV